MQKETTVCIQFSPFYRSVQLYKMTSNGLNSSINLIHLLSAVLNVHPFFKEQNYIFHFSFFQLVMSYMACLESCIGHMMQLSLTDEVCISHMHSLPSAVIQTIKATFKHCKVHNKKVPCSATLTI